VIVATDLSLDAGLLDRHTAVVVLSRTGERRFVLDALVEARAADATVIAITGNPSSHISDIADETIATHEGSEPAYLKSKSTFAGIVALLALAATMSETAPDGLRWDVLEQLPELVEHGFELASEAPKTWFASARDQEHWALLGSGAGYGAAADGALKLQEIALVHASAHPLGFFYHWGP
jgi:glucosamine--fructose-6-phosphate aminotransferase (isomerizing)